MPQPIALTFFEPDRTEQGTPIIGPVKISENKRLAHRQFAPLNNNSEALAALKKAIEKEFDRNLTRDELHFVGDRMLSLSLPTNTQKDLENRLLETALAHSLGAIDHRHGMVRLFGNGNTKYVIRTPATEFLDATREVIGTVFEYLKSEKPPNAFFVLYRKDIEATSIQTAEMLNEGREGCYIIEYQQGAIEKSYDMINLDRDEAIKIVYQWFDGDPSFFDHDWQKI